VADENGIMRKNGVGMVGQGDSMVDDFCASPLEVLHKGVMFRLGGEEIWPGGVMPGFGIGLPKHRIWAAHEDNFEGIDHTLAAVLYYHVLFSFFTVENGEKTCSFGG